MLTIPQLAALQKRVLSLRKYRLFGWLFERYYALATRVFIRFTKRVNSRLAERPILAIYLRRGGGRGELVPGASDLDFFFVLKELDAQAEMSLLKAFWARFRFWKQFFPFLGETLMGDVNELRNWVATPTVRAFEARYSWKLQWGEPLLEKMPEAPVPEMRDVLSESMKYYWAALKPLLHEPSLEISAGDASAVPFRHAAKAILDLYRLHRSFVTGVSDDERERLWRAPREELIPLLEAHYPPLAPFRPLLRLEVPCVKGEALFELLVEHLFRAYSCLNDIAAELAAGENTETAFQFVPHSSRSRLGRDDKYSYAVRELFTERMIQRHSKYLERTLISGETTHIFFPFARDPSLPEFRAVLEDLREAGTSFDYSSVAIPLSERALAEVERTSFLDNPFHSFHEHQGMRIAADGRVRSGPFESHARALPEGMLRKTFAELSLALRFQPPPDLPYVIESIISLVLQLRVADEQGLVPTDFYAAVEKYAERHPLRAAYVREQVGRYLNFGHSAEEAFWQEAIEAARRFGEKDPQRASLVQAQLEALRQRKVDDRLKAMQATTDLWTEITPFLRLEMNSMRDRFFPVRAKLKL